MAFNEVPRGSETILLVEPDPETRKLAAFMLAKQGYTVLEARNTAEAFQHYQESGTQVDLLLTEVFRSDVNGPELARVLEAKDPGLPVVYLSDTENRRLTRRIETRTKAVLLRPFTMRLLADKVRRVLDGSRRTMAAGA
ncbi:MAG TPA: response regulator [Bryobacteraceae bacterium]|nr:response regulator [Bryobacteraceae bacterium]